MAIRYRWRLPVACHSDQLTFDALPPVETVDHSGNTVRTPASPKNGQKSDSL
jgi:hypothetical protein